jgi:membrane-bound serine protease (ClpP class)
MENIGLISIIFFGSILFILLEIFILPGFGIAGIAGVIFFVYAQFLIFKNAQNINHAFMISITLLFVTGAVIYFSIKMLRHTKIGKEMFLENEFTKEDGYVAKDFTLDNYIGKSGITVTELRPYGKIDVNGEIVEVISERSYIEKNVKVRVTRVDTNTLYVEEEV